jgi:archaellum component FlaF (FlaF/FlaG flagellin family)
MLRRVVWYKLIDISEVLAASNITVMIAIMMEAVSTSETSINFTRLHGVTSQKYSHLQILTCGSRHQLFS